MAVLAYNESKIDTRLRNLIGYSLFFASTVMLIVVSNADTVILCDMPNSVLDCIIRLITSILFDVNSPIISSNKFGSTFHSFFCESWIQQLLGKEELVLMLVYVQLLVALE